MSNTNLNWPMRIRTWSADVSVFSARGDVSIQEQAHLFCAGVALDVLASAVEEGQRWVQDPAFVSVVLDNYGQMAAGGGLRRSDSDGDAERIAAYAKGVR